VNLSEYEVVRTPTRIATPLAATAEATKATEAAPVAESTR
jgi:hypothetical protein